MPTARSVPVIVVPDEYDLPSSLPAVEFIRTCTYGRAIVLAVIESLAKCFRVFLQQIVPVVQVLGKNLELSDDVDRIPVLLAIGNANCVGIDNFVAFNVIKVET